MAMIFRLSIMISFVSFFFCLSYAGFMYYKSQEVQQIVEMVHEGMSQDIKACDENSNSVSCSFIKSNQELLNNAAIERNRYKDLYEMMMYCSVAIPAGVAFIFCSVIWVATGRNPIKSIKLIKDQASSAGS